MSELRSSAARTPPPVRIRDGGTDDDRALLRAGDPPLPPGRMREVQAAVEARIARARSPGRRRRVLWGGLGLFAAGSALAMGSGAVRQLWRPEVVAPAHAPAAGGRVAGGPDWHPLPANPVAAETTPAADPPPSPRPRVAMRAPAPVPAAPPPAVAPPGWQPGLREPPGPWPVADDEVAESPERPAGPRAALLRISRQGRPPIALAVSGARIAGQARGAVVSLQLEGNRLHGKIGEQPLSLFAGWRGAHGTIAGEDTGFALAATDGGGAIVRGAVPGHTVRVELADGRLSWYPGCDRPLAERPSVSQPGEHLYRGICADGTLATVVIPDVFLAWPELPRLMVLGILLTERDPMLGPMRRALFPEQP